MTGSRADTLGQTLLSAFVLNLAAGATFLVYFYLSASSAVPAAVAGCIFALATLHLAVGGLLAAWLLFVRKNKLVFLSVLMVQLLVVGLLATVFFMGFPR